MTNLEQISEYLRLCQRRFDPATAELTGGGGVGKRQPQPRSYRVSVVTRDEVGAYKPYLWEQSAFAKGPLFREWLLTKVRLNDVRLQTELGFHTGATVKLR